VSGPDTTTPGAFGEITSWVITQEANSAATELVQYMLSDGYTGWLAQSPEGKVPVRTGTQDNPTEYADAWADLEMGVDTRATMADVYPPEVVETITGIADDMDRWALPQGQGPLLGPLTAELPLARIVADMGSGSMDPTAAQQQMQDAVTELADS
jgi:multiple sugar transport system substrate-binding protein